MKSLGALSLSLVIGQEIRYNVFKGRLLVLKIKKMYNRSTVWLVGLLRGEMHFVPD